MAPDDALVANELVQVLVGQPFTQLRVRVGDAQLLFAGELLVSLEAPARVGDAGVAGVITYGLDGLSLLVPLLGGDVTEAAVSDRGELAVTIGGTTVRCAGTPDYEAWTFNAPTGELVVCTPGGLAIWGPR
ncbi:DUF6188 family protein [Blastococcus sp. CT_GayMR16]|uniref:DUF6188 family protein n=1 Tax=Blastococcus sp. CT_GayMR16 TaxID=2559607 RepID=UPI00107477F6|nr:DUF6188 family protein [Blastococcus sp. CT_GayMR16]TFV87559.1 hypothetical protein E4P38_12985 [Blastococcus sp. CT_GayMR16]